MFLTILALLMGTAHAQPTSPEVQAIYTKLLQEVQSATQCAIKSATLEQENAKLKAELEELKKPKPEAKPEEK